MTAARARQAMERGERVSGEFLKWGAPDDPIRTTGRLTREEYGSKGRLAFWLDGDRGGAWFRPKQLRLS